MRSKRMSDASQAGASDICDPDTLACAKRKAKVTEDES